MYAERNYNAIFGEEMGTGARMRSMTPQTTRSYMAFFSITLMTLAYLPVPEPESGAWSLEVVDPGFVDADPFSDTSLSVDSAGNVHIAYISGPMEAYEMPSSVKYADNSAGSWNTEEIGQIPQGHEHYDVSMVLDSSDWPLLCYSNSTQINYSFKSTSGWSNGHLPTLNWSWNCAIAVDRDDRVHICYTKTVNWIETRLVYAVLASDGWRETVLATESWINSVALAVDQNDFFHVIYDSSTVMKYCTGQVDSSGNAVPQETEGIDDERNGVDAAIVIGSNGTIHVVYKGGPGSNGEIVYLSIYSGEVVSRHVVDGSECRNPDIALDSHDNVFVSYVSFGSSQPDDLGPRLVCAKQGDKGWVKNVVAKLDRDILAFLSTSVAVDSLQTVHISSWSGALWYAKGQVVSSKPNDMILIIGAAVAAVAVSSGLAAYFVLKNRK